MKTLGSRSCWRKRCSTTLAALGLAIVRFALSEATALCEWSVAFKTGFCELKQERLGSRYAARRSAFADRHHLSKTCLVWGFAMAPARTPGGIAALALRKARLSWWPSVSNVMIFAVARRITFQSHLSGSLGQRILSGLRVERLTSTRSLSSRRLPPRLRRNAA
jgi:hypothetical protein